MKGAVVARLRALACGTPHAGRPSNGRSRGATSIACLDPLAPNLENVPVAADDIDRYLRTLDEPKRATLTELRDTIASMVPDAEQCISYGMPAFKLHGKTIAGFAAFKSHLSYLPHSGSVLSQLANETEGYTKTQGSLHFPVDEPLAAKLVRKLLEVRMAEAFGPKARTEASTRSRPKADEHAA